MIEIGEKLQKRRKELKLSYEDVSQVTKLSIPHLKAIEDGNLDYFKDDLTYVRFYVRSYCKALDVPYENFKDDVIESVEEYTNTITLKKQEKIDQVEKNIADRKESKPITGNAMIRKEVENLLKENKGPKLTKKDRASIQQNAQKTSFHSKKGKLDIPMVSFVVVCFIIVALLIYVGVGALFAGNSNEDSSEPKQDPPVVDTTPTPEEDVDKEIEEEKPEVSSVVISQENPTTYTVSNIKLEEAVSVEITFGGRCWFDATLNNAVASAESSNKTFEAGQVLKIESKAGSNDVYKLVFGNFGGCSVKVNGTEVVFDSSIVNATGVMTIYIQVKGV